MKISVNLKNFSANVKNIFKKPVQQTIKPQISEVKTNGSEIMASYIKQTEVRNLKTVTKVMPILDESETKIFTQLKAGYDAINNNVTLANEQKYQKLNEYIHQNGSNMTTETYGPVAELQNLFIEQALKNENGFLDMIKQEGAIVPFKVNAARIKKLKGQTDIAKQLLNDAVNLPSANMQDRYEAVRVMKDIADFENNPALIKDFWQEQTNTAIAKLEDIKNNIADKPYSKKMDKYFEETRYLDYINHYAKDITDKTDKNTYQLLESAKQAVKDLNEFIYDKIRRR